MRPFLCLLAAALFVSAGLAGCMSGSKDTAQPAATTNATGSSKAPPVDTGNLTNNTDPTAQMAHSHDYWQGKERVTIMNAPVSVQPQDALAYTFVDVFRNQDPAVGGTNVALPEGATVFEGTGKMEFTATWTDPTVTGVSLRYHSPASATWSAAKPLTSGTALSIDITPDMTDMPHMQTTRWAFQLVPAAGQVIEGTINVRVDIIKMHDIALWPAHGFAFGGDHTATIFDGQATSTHQGAANAIVDRVTSQGDQPPEGVAAAKVVPMETLWMTANVTITDATSQLGQVRNISFLYKAADSNNFRRANVTHGDITKGIFQFSWPVSMRNADSPYAKTSQWRFDLQISTSDPTGAGVLNQCGGCSDAQVQYKAVVVAYDAPHPVLPDAPAK